MLKKIQEALTGEKSERAPEATKSQTVQREGEVTAERRESAPVVQETVRPRTGWWTERKRGMQP